MPDRLNRPSATSVKRLLHAFSQSLTVRSSMGIAAGNCEERTDESGSGCSWDGTKRTSIQVGPQLRLESTKGLNSVPFFLTYLILYFLKELRAAGVKKKEQIMVRRLSRFLLRRTMSFTFEMRAPDLFHNRISKRRSFISLWVGSRGRGLAEIKSLNARGLNHQRYFQCVLRAATQPRHLDAIR